MNCTLVDLFTRSSHVRRGDFKNGWIALCLPPPSFNPPLRRFEFEVTNFRYRDSRVVLTDGDKILIDLNGQLMEDDPPFTNFPRWSELHRVEREMAQILLAGVWRGVLYHWGLVSQSATLVVENITKEEILTASFVIDS